MNNTVHKKKSPLRMKIGNCTILKGERKRVNLEMSSLFDYTKINIPVEVIRGKEDGPTLFISAAIHGDEINGTEVIKKILQSPLLKKVKGTLILIPVVNIFGFNNKSRYLPDRRDLNRCFPGNSTGSLGSRIANIFMKEIVNKCTHGIDLHTGAIHRTNLPQIRAYLDDRETRKIAESFGTSVIVNSKLRDGSLREAARKKKVSLLLFEGGEALRFENNIIKSGVKGCMAVMREIGILPNTLKKAKVAPQAFVAQSSYWARASHSGSFRTLKKVGDHVKEDEALAVISDTFGERTFEICSKEEGIIIGMSKIPLVSKGDAMIHIATFKNSSKVKKNIDVSDSEFV